MDLTSVLLAAACIVAALAAGCTGSPQAPATMAPGPSSAATVATTVPAGPAANGSPAPSPGCTGDVCTIPIPSGTQAGTTSLKIWASPQRYSPIMSSTPGVKLEPQPAGFTAATYTWNTSYGQFLSWNPPDYTVGQLGQSATGSGTLYWSFTDRPASTAEPVTIHVVARDPASGAVLGTSVVTLSWDGDNAVTVQNGQ